MRMIITKLQLAINSTGKSITHDDSNRGRDNEIIGKKNQVKAHGI